MRRQCMSMRQPDLLAETNLDSGRKSESGTQKIHARGPMGQESLTTKKYVIFGNGQIRG